MACSDMRNIYLERARAALGNMDDEALVEMTEVMEARAKLKPRLKKSESGKGADVEREQLKE